MNFVRVLFLIAALGAPAIAQKTMKPEPVKVPASSANAGRVQKIDDIGLKDVLKATDKPRVVNFWATWCAPCIEEFPDLVKIDGDYKGKIDVVTVSLDDVADINTLVPDFLKRMKAEMPAFLLVSQDESLLISTVQKDWNGGLPFTIIYGADGGQIYFREGKFKPVELRAEIDKAIGAK